MHRHRSIVQAWLETPSTALVELVRDWPAREAPDLRLAGGSDPLPAVPVDDATQARICGFFLASAGTIQVVLRPSLFPQLDAARDRVFLAGDFSGWAAAIGKPAWEMQAACLAGEPVLVWSGPASQLLRPGGQRFKFVTHDKRWLPVPQHVSNASLDHEGNLNFLIDPERTGRHLFRVSFPTPIDLSRQHSLEWVKGAGQGAPLRPDGFFHELHTDLELGALVHGGETVFRIFAPRATQVELCLSGSLASGAQVFRYPLRRRAEPADHVHEALSAAPATAFGSAQGPVIETPDNWQGVWEVLLDQNLHGWYYWYHVDGPKGPFSGFDPSHRVLDPYALACVGPRGPGIVLNRSWIGQASQDFQTPGWQDLVIAEAHVRDLSRHAPIPVPPEQRNGFEALRTWVEGEASYFNSLGVNCVELQPVQENDAAKPSDYHWGYMTANWFCPASQYSSNPALASGVHELKALVSAFHEQGIAVILDVVYNHVGEPAHLMFLDRELYFETDRAGKLSNWSGCGNDFRARSAMGRRLIIDSCIHLIRAYGVDGFRFDLAELIGTPVLVEIERALKQVKPDVILIAEPWSFRGHIAGELSTTGWSSWNDGFRTQVREYLLGGSSSIQLEYYLKGSPWYFARWPAQTVNYTESHDDKTWIDLITENPQGNGLHPSPTDQRRTRLMGAILFASLGIPMISSGQDFLRSKHGVNNTYLRGDLNALDYRRALRYSATHGYFASWIRFRLGDNGQLLRLWSAPSEGYFKAYRTPGSQALALLYNANNSLGPARLLFAINPASTEIEIPLDDDAIGGLWLQVADQDRFSEQGVPGMEQPVERSLFLTGMSCGLWLRCEPNS